MSERTLQSYIAIFAIAGLLTSGASASVRPAVTILAETTVAGREIYLGNLLAPGSRSAALADRLDRIFIAAAPLPGRTRAFSSTEVNARLAAAGITSERYALTIPAEIRVTRQFQTWTPSDIATKIRQDWMSQLPWESTDLERIDILENVLLPVGDVRLSFDYSPRTDLCQPFSLRVNFQIDGTVVWRSFYRTVLAISHTLPAAVRNLSPADRIEAGDVRWEQRRLTSTLRTPVHSVEFLEDKKPKSTISAGQVLFEDSFVTAPLIKRGDNIVLVFEENSLRITAKGKSLASGSRGGRIRVMNLDSKKEFVAEIVDAKTVRVNF